MELKIEKGERRKTRDERDKAYVGQRIENEGVSSRAKSRDLGTESE